MAAPLETTAERDTASLEAFVAGYRPLPGIFDEMMDRRRPGARALAAVSQHAGRRSAPRRSTAASPPPTATCATPACSIASMRIAAGNERAWPLSHVPLLIEPDRMA